MTWGDVTALAALILGVLAAAINGRSALAAQKRKSLTDEKVAKVDDDLNAGKLALDYAKDVKERLLSLEDWREALTYEWLPQHFARDQAIEQELLKLDPAARIPAATPLPPLRKRRIDNPPTP